MYDPKILKQVEGEVKPIYAEIKAWTHGFKHVSGVVKAAKDLAEMEGADPVLCQIAAYCHDLGRLEEEEKNLVNPKPGTPSAHAVFSVKPTNKILDKVGIKGKDREKILEAVKLHNIRKYEGDNEILLVIQDADRADGFGKLAILRFATFNCEMLIPEPQNPKEVDEDFEKMMSILKEDHIKRKIMIQTLEYVSNWYTGLLNTKSAKIYIKKNWLFNEKIAKELKSI